MRGRSAHAAVSWEYRFDPLPSRLSPTSPYACSEGTLRLFVNGMNLCELDRDPPAPFGQDKRFALHDHLFPYLKWLSGAFNGFFQDDPFPIQVPAGSAAEFDRLGRHALGRLRDVERIERVSEAFGDWISRHCFALGTDGGTPPNLFFRRVGNAIEVSWDNEDVRPYRGRCRYRQERGVESVDCRDFHGALKGFVSDFLEDLCGRHPGLREHREIREALEVAEGFLPADAR